jgi:hypothetical protein
MQDAIDGLDMYSRCLKQYYLVMNKSKFFNTTSTFCIANRLLAAGSGLRAELLTPACCMAMCLQYRRCLPQSTRVTGSTSSQEVHST